MGAVAGGGDPEAVPHEVFLQERADAFVIIDDQKVNLGLGTHGAPSFIER